MRESMARRSTAGGGTRRATCGMRRESVIAAQDTGWRDAVQPESVPPGNAKIPATTYFPERLPSQYLRRWRA